jgi:hypothetical protein
MALGRAVAIAAVTLALAAPVAVTAETLALAAPVAVTALAVAIAAVTLALAAPVADTALALAAPVAVTVALGPSTLLHGVYGAPFLRLDPLLVGHRPRSVSRGQPSRPVLGPAHRCRELESGGDGILGACDLFGGVRHLQLHGLDLRIRLRAGHEDLDLDFLAWAFEILADRSFDIPFSRNAS